MPTSGKKEKLIQILQKQKEQGEEAKLAAENKVKDDNDVIINQELLMENNNKNDHEEKLNYLKMSIIQLKDEHKKRNLIFKSKMKKLELIANLIDYDDRQSSSS